MKVRNRYSHFYSVGDPLGNARCSCGTYKSCTVGDGQNFYVVCTHCRTKSHLSSYGSLYYRDETHRRRCMRWSRLIAAYREADLLMSEAEAAR